MRIWPLVVWATLLALLCAPPRHADAQRDRLQELARRVAPDGSGVPAQLSHYIRCFQDATFQDARVFAFHVDARLDGDGVIELTGYIEFPELRDSLLVFLRHLGFSTIRDRTERLPSKQLGKLRFGFVTATHTLVRTQPGESAETATDAVLGEPLFLLREAEHGFLLCHTAEGYLGYIRDADVLRVDATAFHQYQTGKRVVVRSVVQRDGCVTLPVGARLKWRNQSTDKVTLQLPGGRDMQAPRGSVTVTGDRTDPRLDHVVAAARRFLGTQYVWGGKTVAGVDCSGLVQTSFDAAGLHLPRDANQQAIVGRLVATRWYRQDLRRGDTLYFLGSPGKVTHTAIYLRDGQYLEAVRPIVRISSLNPEDANYSRRGAASFAFAKRLLD